MTDEPVTRGQLRLAPDRGDERPVLFDIDVPERLLRKVARLEPSAQLELALRAPEELQDLVARICEVRTFTDAELMQRRAHLEREHARLTSEIERRAAARQPA